MPENSSIAQEHELLRLIIETSTEGVVILDEDGHVLRANRASKLPGLDIGALLSPPRSPEVASFLADLRENGRAFTELRLRGPDGQPRHVAVEGKTLVRHEVLILRDVTDARRIEEELRHLQRVESVGYLTASVVHDFNNLLTPMVCLSELLANTLDGDKARQARELTSASARAARLVQKLLAFARRDSTRPERVNVSAAVAAMRGLVERVAGEGIEVVLALDMAIGDTVIDRELFDHVVLNLAANARDAMPQGGRLTIQTANVPLPDACAEGSPDESRDAYVMVTVTDDGVGMSTEVRERVFERFFTTKDAGHGTGLGLAAAHRFATQNGGCISVRSEPTQGTAVAIYLPRAAAEEAPSAPSGVRTLPRGSETILVVEDDEHVRACVEVVLQDQGYRVLGAASGAAALEVAARHDVRIDLVLADVVMPKMSGRTLADKLRAAGLTAPIVFMSGHTDKAIADYGVRAGDGPILRKAFTPSQLARHVRDALDGAAPVSFATGARARGR